MSFHRQPLTAVCVFLGLLVFENRCAHCQDEDGPTKVSRAQLLEDPHVIEAVQLLDLWIESQWAFDQLPGVSVGVVHDQEMIWSRGFGFADVEEKTPATPDTVYSICSISKLFTSIGVLQLRDGGKLNLNDSVTQHIPWFKIKNAHPDSSPITVEALLTHSAGIPRESDHPYWTAPGFPFPTRQEIIDTVSNQSTLYPASTYYQYSNLGLTLAGELITQLSGQDYETYMQEEILAPLGLANTRPSMPSGDCCGLASGYGYRNRTGQREKLPPFQARGIAPAAGFSSTVNDLGRFASWQFRVLAGKHELLKPTTLKEMQRVHWIDPDWGSGSHRGLGFGVWRSDQRTFVGHGGGCPGYLTHLSLDPKRKIAAIFMTNGLGAKTELHTRRAHQILGAAIHQAATSSDEAKAPDQAMGQYQGLYKNPWGETAVVLWKGDLNLLPLPTEDPLGSLVKLKKDGEHVFRRDRKDEELGETVRFELDDSGKVTRFWRHGNYSTRVP